MTALQDLLLDLFHYVRQDKNAVLPLTLEEFDLLCQMVELDDPIQNWDELSRMCCLAWVNSYDDQLKFEACFQGYRQRVEIVASQWIEQFWSQSEVEPQPPTPDFVIGELPKIPPRRSQLPEPPSESPSSVTASDPKPTGIAAVQTNVDEMDVFRLQKLPVNLAEIQQFWRKVRRSTVSMMELEVDIDGTIEHISREGYWREIVQRPVMRCQGELLFLIDDDNPMIPFNPVIEPWIRWVTDNRVKAAQLYRFTTVPTQYLYPWGRPAQAEAVKTVLSRLHQQRTTVLIVSDAGAASQTYSPRRARLTAEFLDKLNACVREIVWINPMPEFAWLQTTAELIGQVLAGRMVPLEPEELMRIAQGKDVEEGVQLWTLAA